MKLLECMICWTPHTSEIDIVPWPDPARRSKRFRMSVGACDLDLRKMPVDLQIAMLFIHFHTVVVRDRVPVDAAHRAFFAIDEYRDCISPDTPKPASPEPTERNRHV